MKRAYIVLGMLLGDEGKGALTDFLARQIKPSLIVKFCGGSQAAHTVMESSGRTHVFSQWGSGTLAGVPTHVGPNVIVNPPAMVREGKRLEEIGVEDPWSMISISPECLVTTRYHQISNQVSELLRGRERHGSCGHGIGETRAYWLKHGQDAVFAEDLRSEYPLLMKVRLIQSRLINQLSRSKIIDTSEEVLALIGRLINDSPEEVARELRTSKRVAVRNVSMEHQDTVVFEGNQGILLDQDYGFHPHTTWSTVTSKHALEMIPEGTPTTTIGCIRSYMTRHGEGPFPTHSEMLTRELVDPGNPKNEWQGALRCGWLDLPLLRYAIEANGGIDGFAVSHLDQLPREWCEAYHPGHRWPTASDIPNLEEQERIGNALVGRVCMYSGVLDEEWFLDRLGMFAPVLVRSHGRTAEDRIFTDSWK